MNKVKQTTLERINQLERQIYLHSYLYYEKNTNVVEDYVFDKMMTNLAEMRNKYPSKFSQSEFYEDYKDWDEGSGAFLNYDIPSIRKIAKVLYHVK